MKVSELARRAGMSPSGVRWYEAAGVLPAPTRGANGYRVYSEADLARLSLVVSLRRLGLGPAEAGALAGRCLDGGPLDPRIGELLQAQQQAIIRQRSELDRVEIQLRDLQTTLGATSGRRSMALSAATPIRVLFVCNGNSARSQMAEALLDRSGGGDFLAASAGTRPKLIHPLTVAVLAEDGIDWGAARSKSIEAIRSTRFDYVITLSDSAREECPSLPGPHSSLHWHLDDPAAVEGTSAEQLAAFRLTHDELALRISPFVELARIAADRQPTSAEGPREQRSLTRTQRARAE